MAFRALTLQPGQFKQIADLQFLSPGGGLDPMAAGSLVIGGPNTTSVEIGNDPTGGGPTTSISIGTQSALTTLDMGTGVNVTGVNIGTAMAGPGTITIGTGWTGSAPITTIDLKGDVHIYGLETVDGDTIFNENVVFGDGLALPDTVAFRSTIGNGTYNDFVFTLGSSHVIYIEDAAGASDSDLTIRGQKSSSNPGSPVTVQGGESTGAQGGNLNLWGGVGVTKNGDVVLGSAGFTGSHLNFAGYAKTNLYWDGDFGSQSIGMLAPSAGAGASITIHAGAAFAGNGGSLGLDAGPAVAGIDGNVEIGLVNTSLVRVGTDIEFTDASRIIYVAQAAVDINGKDLTIRSGQGGSASAVAGGTGGIAGLEGAPGGAGTAALQAGRGGLAYIQGGSPISAFAGFGNAGGDVRITGGAAVEPGLTLRNGGTVWVDAGLPLNGGFSSVQIGKDPGGGGNTKTISLYTGNTARLFFDNAGPPAKITVQSNTTLECTGTGMINLPQNFEIDGTPTNFAVLNTGQVTAPNLDILTAGPASDATSLHTHAGIGGAATTLQQVWNAGENIVAIGSPVYLAYDVGSSTPRVYNGDATNGAKVYIVGLAQNAPLTGAACTVITVGELPVDIVDGTFATAPTTADVGLPVYLDTTTGELLLDASVLVATEFRVKIGLLSASQGPGTPNKNRVFVQMGEVVGLS